VQRAARARLFLHALERARRLDTPQSLFPEMKQEGWSIVRPETNLELDVEPASPGPIPIQAALEARPAVTPRCRRKLDSGSHGHRAISAARHMRATVSAMSLSTPSRSRSQLGQLGALQDVSVCGVLAFPVRAFV